MPEVGIHLDLTSAYFTYLPLVPLLDPRAAPQSFLQALMLMKGAPPPSVGLAQELPGSQTRQRASPGSCEDSNPWHELGNRAGAEKGCAVAQGSFSPRFSH